MADEPKTVAEVGTLLSRWADARGGFVFAQVGMLPAGLPVGTRLALVRLDGGNAEPIMVFATNRRIGLGQVALGVYLIAEEQAKEAPLLAVPPS